MSKKDKNSNRASEEALDKLHKLVASKLAEIIENGRVVITKDGDRETVDVDAATISAAIRFLSENDIKAIPAKGTPLGDLLDQLQEGMPGDDGAGELSDEDYARIKQECIGNG